MSSKWHDGLRIIAARHHRTLRDMIGLSAPKGQQQDTEIERIERFLAVINFDFVRAYDHRITDDELAEYDAAKNTQNHRN